MTSKSPISFHDTRSSSEGTALCEYHLLLKWLVCSSDAQGTRVSVQVNAQLNHSQTLTCVCTAVSSQLATSFRFIAKREHEVEQCTDVSSPTSAQAFHKALGIARTSNHCHPHLCDFCTVELGLPVRGNKLCARRRNRAST